MVISPKTMTMPVLVAVSQATFDKGSCAKQASRMASETWSAILSGWPSPTDSDYVFQCVRSGVSIFPLFFSSFSFRARVRASPGQVLSWEVHTVKRKVPSLKCLKPFEPLTAILSIGLGV